MHQFQVLDERRYPLKVKGIVSVGYMKNQSVEMDGNGDMLPFWRWEHRVTIGYNAREFMVFVDQLEQSIYVEEIVGGHLETVEDTSLFESILEFANDNDFCGMFPPIMKPTSERFV